MPRDIDSSRMNRGQTIYLPYRTQIHRATPADLKETRWNFIRKLIRDLLAEQLECRIFPDSSILLDQSRAAPRRTQRFAGSCGMAECSVAVKGPIADQLGRHDEVACPFLLIFMEVTRIQIGRKEWDTGKLFSYRLENEECIVRVSSQDSDGLHLWLLRLDTRYQPTHIIKLRWSFWSLVRVDVPEPFLVLRFVFSAILFFFNLDRLA